MTPTTAQKWQGLFKQRCPRCCDGRIYERGSKMHRQCPTCGMLFDREPGYFLGAMYISYALTSAFLFVGLMIGYLLFPEFDLGSMVLICAACFIPFVPMT